jgi:hypothetical protein
VKSCSSCNGPRHAFGRAIAVAPGAYAAAGFLDRGDAGPPSELASASFGGGCQSTPAGLTGPNSRMRKRLKYKVNNGLAPPRSRRHDRLMKSAVASGLGRCCRKSRRHLADAVTLFKDALLFQQLLDPSFPGTVGDHLTDRTRESAGASQARCICYRKNIVARAPTHVWFRSHRIHVGLACIALTATWCCPLAISMSVRPSEISA